MRHRERIKRIPKHLLFMKSSGYLKSLLKTFQFRFPLTLNISVQHEKEQIENCKLSIGEQTQVKGKKEIYNVNGSINVW